MTNYSMTQEQRKKIEKKLTTKRENYEAKRDMNWKVGKEDGWKSQEQP